MIISSRNLKDQGRTWNYGHAETINIVGEDHWPVELTEKLGEFSFPQPYVTEVEEVSLCGPIGVGIKGEDIFLDTGYSGRLDVLERNAPYKLWAFEARRLKATYLDAAVSMVGVWSGNYFHWLLEFLARMEAVEVYEKETGIKPVVVVEATPPSFVTETLEFLNYGYVPMNNHHVMVKKLIIPTFRRKQGRTAPGVVSYLREKFGWRTKKNKDIWVSRENASERRVVDAEKAMGDRTKLNNENLSFREQVETYMFAKSIAGPHGAGLTNMIWANNVEVIELFGSYINPCYMTLAAACGHSYTPQFCQPEGKDIRWV